MDRARLRDYARKLSRIDATDVTNDELDVFLDEGYDRVLMHTTWEWAKYQGADVIELLANEEYYVIADDIIAITSMMHERGYELRSLTKNQIDQMHHRGETLGDPRYYYWNGNKVYIHPMPSADGSILNFHFTRQLTFASDDLDVPPFHPTFHRILVDWALHRLWEMEEDFEKSQEYRMRFEEGINRMTAWYNTLMQDTPSIYGESVFTTNATNMPFLTDPQLL